MRRLLSLLALSFATACSADQFVNPTDAGGGNDATSDVTVLDAAPPDGGPVVDGGQGDAGIGPPVLVGGLPANVDLYGVWGSSPSDYWVVGSDKSQTPGFFAHWTGSSFVQTTSAAPAALRAVWGTANGVFIVGDKDPITTYALAIYIPQNGQPKAVAPNPTLQNRNLVAVWYDEQSTDYFLQTDASALARSSASYTSVIDIQGAQIPAVAAPCVAMHARFQVCAGGVFGAAAQVAQSGSTNLKLRAIHVTNAQVPTFFVAGDSGYLARNVGAAWASFAGPSVENLEGIWSTALGEAVAVGAHGTILGTLTGLTATPNVVLIPPVPNNNEDLHAVTVVGQGLNRIFIAVGNKGTVLTRKF